MIPSMSDEERPDNFEETLRQMAQSLGETFEKVTRGDLDDIVRATGIDPDFARRWVSEHFQSAPAGPQRPAEDPLRGAAPHPLDTPTEEQGRALAALESGRWSIEPGTSMLVSHGDGPAPKNALGLVRELRVRDWIGADGAVTLAGRAALGRWLA
jgi:hypothetical protein